MKAEIDHRVAAVLLEWDAAHPIPNAAWSRAERQRERQSVEVSVRDVVQYHVHWEHSPSMQRESRRLSREGFMWPQSQ